MTFLPIRALPALALGLLCGVTGACAGGGTTVGTSPAASGTGSVRYLGAVIQVPAGWPVYDLGADRRRCARLDVHAVYLGHQGPDAACPARLLGKTEAVQVEPLDDVTRARARPPAASRQINGEAASIQPGSTASHNIVATYPALGLVVTASYNGDESLAQGIVDSVRAGGR